MRGGRPVASIRSMKRSGRVLVACLVLAVVAAVVAAVPRDRAPGAGVARAADLVGWGADINTGAGPALVEAARGRLAAIVKSPAAERGALIAAWTAERGLPDIEAAKRFRNPELKELFVALLGHENWRVQHRAMFALEYYQDPAVLPRIWPLMKSAEVRVREKAVIACIKLWDAKAAATAAGGDAAAAIAALLAAETDDHVRSCLAALAERAAGKLRVERVHEEFLRTDPDGLSWTPFLDGMDKVGQVAPGYVKKSVSRAGGGDAAKLGPAPRWIPPLLLFMDEEVKGTSLQPFANLRANGTMYHTGLDVGACLDGTGFYAAADGYVRWVLSGSDMGTLIVLQHSADGRENVNAVYMHGGGVAFVAGGDKVRAGQLLGTMGMSYSIENGGHYSHLHYGLYPGGFSETHNYGYKPVSAGLADWTDPAKFIPQWVARTKPFVSGLRAVDPALAKAADLARAGAMGRAWGEAEAVAKRAGVTEAQAADAAHLQERIAAGCEDVVVRARAQRAEGWPSASLAMLQKQAAEAKGAPGAAAIAAEAAVWTKDAAFQREVKAEAAIDATAARVAKLFEKQDKKDKGDSAEKAAALWDALLKEWGDTPLRARIEERIGKAPAAGK